MTIRLYVFRVHQRRSGLTKSRHAGCYNFSDRQLQNSDRGHYEC